MQKWKTSIYKEQNGDIYVRGERLLDLIGKMSFTDAIFFVLRGVKPTEAQTGLLDVILVSAINHGLEAPSAFVPRIVASTGNSVNSALASGVLSIGDYHGGAVEECMRILQSGESAGKSAQKIVEEMVRAGKRMPGYGHKVYKDVDPRAEKIGEAMRLAGKNKFWDLAVDIQKELEKQTGKKLPLNIDGAMAAVLCELGFEAIQGKAFFALARIPTMMANIEEELKNEKPYRRLDEEDVEYVGK